MSTMKRNFEYYLNNQQELVRQYRGKVLVIVEQQVVGIYSSEFEAIAEATKQYTPGTFLVQRCEPGTESYTQTYHSRIAFG